MDDMGHGTHVAATAAGNGAFKGVAPDAKILAYKVLDSSGSGSFSNVIAGIERAVDPNNDGDTFDHADIISMSLGAGCSSYDETCGPDDAVSMAVDIAVDAGVIAVIAAGNSGPDAGTIGSPGTARKAITVGAVDKQKVIAEFSSRGPVETENELILKPDVLAPGVNICAAQSSQDRIWESVHNSNGVDAHCLDQSHISISGTSMATPHVAGAAALLKQSHPSWTPEEIKSALMMSAENLGYFISEQGNGFIDVNKANKIGIMLSPPKLGFENIIDRLPRPIRISFKNNQPQPITLTFKVDCGVAFLSKNNLTIMPNATEYIFMSIVDLPEKEGLISGTISVSDGTTNYRLPYALNSFSKLTMAVSTGQEVPHFDFAVVNEDLTYIKQGFDAQKTKSFNLPSGEYIVYAGGDAMPELNPPLEYLLMKKVSVPKHQAVPVNLNIREAKPFKIIAKSLDNIPLLLYEWQKGYKTYNQKGCHLTYDLTDPIYGDRTVYVSNSPSNNLDTDVFFKYDGVPTNKLPNLDGELSSSRSFNWFKCE